MHTRQKQNQEQTLENQQQMSQKQQFMSQKQQNQEIQNQQQQFRNPIFLSKQNQEQTRDNNRRREAGVHERARRELEQFWQDIRDKNQQRTATEQRARLARAVQPISRRVDVGSPRPTAATKGQPAGEAQSLQHTGT